MDKKVPGVLLDSFERNGRVNAAVLDALSEGDLDVADGRGGLSVGQHLGHLAGFRRGWLGRVSPAHAQHLPLIVDRDETTFWLTTRELSAIGTALALGDRAALAAVEDAYRDGRPFERFYTSDPAHFLQHILVHDAHHRGQILSLLRQHGRTAEQMNELDAVTWPVWRE